MAGYRMRRKTKNATYVAANSTLTLPWAYSNSTDDGINGVFPEFFYNFQNKEFNADLGVVFRGNNGWHIFAWGEGTISNKWYDKKISLSAGTSISCAVYTDNGKLILKVNGTPYSIPVLSGAFAELNEGCTVTREANLVPQLDNSNMNACTLLRTNAYFTGAAWSNTTLTTTSSILEKMNTTNTTFDKAQDIGDPSAMDLNCFTHKESLINGYVKDDCSIDFTKRRICK